MWSDGILYPATLLLDLLMLPQSRVRDKSTDAWGVLTLFMSSSCPWRDTRQSKLPSGLHTAPASPPDSAPTYGRRYCDSA